MTRNKWWSLIVFKILAAFFLSYYFPVICWTSSVNLSNELRPTVIPEKNPPAHDRTVINEIITNRQNHIPPKGRLIPVKNMMLLFMLKWNSFKFSKSKYALVRLLLFVG